ncbi:MAG: hypothetical protein PVJ60_08815 [Phycisphaerales bacterium]|jgi:hypothetical protein
MSGKPRNIGVIIVLLLLAFLAFGTVSCAHRSLQIVPIRSQNVLTLSSDDVVRVMRRAGFSDGQIMEYGTHLHDALSQSGAAQVKTKRGVKAVFAIKEESVYISSRYGNFIYNVNTGWVARNK